MGKRLVHSGLLPVHCSVHTQINTSLHARVSNLPNSQFACRWKRGRRETIQIQTMHTWGKYAKKKKKNTSQANANQRLQWDNVYKHIYKQQQVHYSNQTFYGWCTCTWFSIFINQYFLCCETKKTINYFFHRYKHIVFDAFVVERMAATIVVPKLYFYYNVNVLCITLIKAI